MVKATLKKCVSWKKIQTARGLLLQDWCRHPLWGEVCHLPQRKLYFGKECRLPVQWNVHVRRGTGLIAWGQSPCLSTEDRKQGVEIRPAFTCVCLHLAPERLCLVQIGTLGLPAESCVVPNREPCSNVKGTGVLWSVNSGAIIKGILSLCLL